MTDCLLKKEITFKKIKEYEKIKNLIGLIKDTTHNNNLYFSAETSSCSYFISSNDRDRFVISHLKNK